MVNKGDLKRDKKGDGCMFDSSCVSIHVSTFEMSQKKKRKTCKLGAFPSIDE